MLLKVAIKYYCVKNKGEIIYEENSIKRSMPIICIMFELKRSWVSKSNENNKIKEGQLMQMAKMKLLSHQIIHWRQRKNMFMNI